MQNREALLLALHQLRSEILTATVTAKTVMPARNRMRLVATAVRALDRNPRLEQGPGDKVPQRKSYHRLNHWTHGQTLQNVLCKEDARSAQGANEDRGGETGDEVLTTGHEKQTYGTRAAASPARITSTGASPPNQCSKEIAP